MATVAIDLIRQEPGRGFRLAVFRAADDLLARATF
jgi:hypothetical protein